MVLSYCLSDGIIFSTIYRHNRDRLKWTVIAGVDLACLLQQLGEEHFSCVTLLLNLKLFLGVLLRSIERQLVKLKLVFDVGFLAIKLDILQIKPITFPCDVQLVRERIFLSRQFHSLLLELELALCLVDLYFILELCPFLVNSELSFVNICLVFGQLHVHI